MFAEHWYWKYLPALPTGRQAAGRQDGMNCLGWALDAQWVRKRITKQACVEYFHPLCICLTSTSESFCQNCQDHPVGIGYSTEFVIAVLQDVQHKVFNRILLLSADFGRGKAPQETVTASKSAWTFGPPFLSREKVTMPICFEFSLLLSLFQDKESK